MEFLIFTFPSLWLLAVSSAFHCFIDVLTKDLTLTTILKSPCASVSNYVRPYHRLYDSQSMQLPMMLTFSYNLSLLFCQSVVDLLCLSFLFCMPFVPMVMNLFFRVVHTIFQLRCLLVTSRSKVGK